jgi:hypothetical protein
MEYSIPGHDVLSPPFIPPSLFHRRKEEPSTTAVQQQSKCHLWQHSSAANRWEQAAGCVCGGSLVVFLLHKWRSNKQYNH